MVFRNRSINFRSLIREELGFIWQMRYTYPSAHFEHLQHLQEIIPSRSICLVYDHHRPLNTAARKFQQMLTKAEPGHPAAPEQAEGVSFISQ